jgi:TetR/AcrR family transcriptional regulator, cholesterol catabolism regulator
MANELEDWLGDTAGPTNQLFGSRLCCRACGPQPNVTRLPRPASQGAPPPAVRDRQRRREELIDIACRVFAEKGFDGATLQDIADQFGVLKGSLFHYIQSKDDLLFEIIDGVYAGADEAIWSIAGADDTAVGRLSRLIVAYVRYVTEHQPAITVWLHDLGSLDPARRQVIRDRDERNRRRLVDLITQAQQEGGVRPDADPRLVCFALLGSMNWVHRWFGPQHQSAEQIGREFSRIYLGQPAQRKAATAS